MSQLQSVLTFDGIDDYIEVPSIEKHYPQAFTISCWVNIREIRDDGMFLIANHWHTTREGNRGYALCVNPTHFYYTIVSLYLGDNRSKPSLNVWTHVTSTFEGGKTKIYVNGQTPVEGKKAPIQVLNSHISLFIGAGHTSETGLPTCFFSGQIAEVCIWNKARTQQEIQSDMGKRLTGKEEGLVGYWPLNEGSGNIATDKTSNGKNGIIKGATWSQQEIPLTPIEPTTGEFQVPINSLTGIEFTNKLAKESSYKFTPSGTWNTPSDNQERTAAGLKGFPPEIQPFYIEELRQYQQYLKYPNNTYLALLAVNKTTGVVTEVTEEKTIVLRADEALTFLVNYFPTEYQNNTGTLTVKWSAT